MSKVKEAIDLTRLSNVYLQHSSTFLILELDFLKKDDKLEGR